MIDLVARLQRGEGEEDEATEWILQLERATSNPHISDLIFYPDEADEDLTAEQIVDKALSYRPFEL